MKKAIILLLAGFAAVLLAGCALILGQPSAAEYYDGWFAVWRDTLYYADESDEGLYRSNQDLSGKQKLAEDCSKILSVSAEGIVYDGDQGLLKVDLSGNHPMLLAEDARASYQATRQWVYYQNYDGEFWRVSIDGQQKEMLWKGSVYPIRSGEDWCFAYHFDENAIYFCPDNQKPVQVAIGLGSSNSPESICCDGSNFYIGSAMGLYRYAPVSNRLTKLVIGSASNLQVTPEGILYLDYLKQLQLLPYDSGTPVLLAENVRDSRAFYREGWIYYLDGTDFTEEEGLLYRIRTDGTDRTRLTSQTFWAIQYVGSWIYCEGVPTYSGEGIERDTHYTLYRVSTDGTQTKPFSSRTDPGSESSVSWQVFTDDYVYTLRKDFNYDYFTVTLTGEGRQEAEQDDRLSVVDTPRGEYYTSSESQGVYLADQDGTDRKLSDLGAENLQFFEDWLYFISPGTASGTLFRMAWNGTKIEPVSSLPISQYIISGSRLFYYSGEDLSVTNCAPDGSDPHVLFSAADPTLLGVEDDWLYYNSSGLYKIRISGTDNQLVCSPEVILYNPVLADGWIYAHTRDSQTCRVNPQTGAVKMISHDSLSLVANEGEHLYFNTGDSLVRMDKSTQSFVVLTEDVAVSTKRGDRFLCQQSQATLEMTAQSLR